MNSMLVLFIFCILSDIACASCPYITQSVYNGHIEQPQNAATDDEAKVICNDPYVVSNKRTKNMTVLKCQSNGTWDGQIPNCKPKTTRNPIYYYKPHRFHSVNGTVVREMSVKFGIATAQCSAECWKDIRCLHFNLIFKNNSDVICQMLDIPLGIVESHQTGTLYEFIDNRYCATYQADQFVERPENSYWYFSNTHLVENGFTATLNCNKGYKMVKESCVSPEITCESGFWIGENITETCVDNQEHYVLLSGSTTGGDRTIEIYNTKKPDNGYVISDSVAVRFGHQSTVFDDGTIVIAGGHKNGYVDDADILNPNSTRTTLHMSEARGYFAVAMLNNQMIVCGGVNSAATLATCEKLFCSSTGLLEWSFFAEMNIARYGLAMVSFKNSLYVMGGRYGTTFYADAERYDAGTNSWKNITAMNNARAQFAAAELDGFIYVCGGDTSSTGKLNNCEIYHPELEKWSKVKALNEPAYGFNMLALGGRLYAFMSNQDRNVETYDPVEDEWKILNYPMKKRHEYASAVVIGIKELSFIIDSIKLFV